MDNFVNVLSKVTIWFSAGLIVVLIAHIFYSFFRTMFKFRAEIRLERELAYLAKQDGQVRQILTELESEIASKGVNPKTYDKACDAVSRAARSLKADERSAIWEGTPLSLPHISKIVKQSLGLVI